MNGGAGASQRLARLLTLPRARAHALVVIVTFAAVYAFGVLRRKGFIDGFGHVIGGDLLMPRAMARIVLDRRGDALYDFTVQAAYQQAAVEPQRLPGLNVFTSPPFVALLYVPWALVPQAPALVLWTALCLASLATALVIMARGAPLTGSHWPSTFLLSLSFYPVLEALMAGSNSLLAVPIFALVLVALRAGREASAGALLGLLFFRPQLGIAPLLVFTAKRRWRVVVGAAAVGAVWVAASVLFIGRRTLLDFLALGPLLSRMIFEPGMPTALFCSIYAFFLLPLGPEHFGLAMAMATVASVGLLALVLWVWRGPWDPHAERLGLRFAALVAVTPLVSPYLQLHDLCVLIIPALLVAEYWLGHGAGESWARVRIVLAILWLSCLVGPPIITRLAPLPLVPLAVLLLGWVVLDTWRAAQTRA